MDEQHPMEKELSLWIAERIARELKIPKERIDPKEAIARYGMDSLRAVALVADLEDHLRTQIDVAAAWEHPTIELLARHLSTLVSPRPEPRAAVSGPKLGSGMQHTIWRLQERYPGTYVTARALRLLGELDLDLVRRALAIAAERHPLLRTAYRPGPEGLLAEELPAAQFELRVENAEGRSEAELAELLSELGNLSSDPTRPPLGKMSLVRRSNTEHLFVLAFSHLVFDAWSFFVLARELDVILSALSRGETPQLEPVTSGYPELALSERPMLEAEGAELTRFWREQLEGKPHWAPVPTDRPRGENDELWVLPRVIGFDAESTRAVVALAASCEATLFHVMLTGFALLLGEQSGQEQLAILSAVDRRYPRQRHAVGPFINHVSFLIDLSGDPSVTELVQRVRGVTQAGLAHKALPFGQVIDAVGADWKDRTRLPLFQLQCNYYDFRAGAEQAPVYRELIGQMQQRQPRIPLGPLVAEPIGIPRRKAPFDLSLNISAGEELGCRLEYSEARFSAGTVDALLARYRALLAAMVREPSARAHSLCPPARG